MPGCCWRPVAQRQSVLFADSRAPTPGSNGMIPIAAYPEATQPHAREHRGETVYIVGWGTEHEMLFLADDAKAAVAYRNRTDRGLRLDPVTGGQLPNEAIIDLYR